MTANERYDAYDSSDEKEFYFCPIDLYVTPDSKMVCKFAASRLAALDFIPVSLCR